MKLAQLFDIWHKIDIPEIGSTVINPKKKPWKNLPSQIKSLRKQVSDRQFQAPTEGVSQSQSQMHLSAPHPTTGIRAVFSVLLK